MTVHATGSGVPLWQLLQAVAHALVQLRGGASSAECLKAVATDIRPGVQALFYQVLRQLGRAQALRDQLVQRRPVPLADALLSTALALAWNEELAPYASHTLVNQAVEAAKRSRKLNPTANFLNACLRRFLREREALVQASDHDPQAVWNHPRWWIEKLQAQYPEHWQSILAANNRSAPMTWRVNTARTSRQALQLQWQEKGLTSQSVGEQGLILDTPRPVHEVPGFSQGLCSVQDAAAQCAAQLLVANLPPKTKLHVLDACAAPGGKTAHLLELLQGNAEVVALDIDPRRCQRIHENLQRLGLSARVLSADAAQPDSWWNGQAFDAILLDAPCTASGIVRRHPDVRWLRRASDVAQLAATQRHLLAQLWPLLRVGGYLLYCTCSVFQEEGQQQVQAFAQRNTDVKIWPSLGHLRPQNQQMEAAVADNLAGDHDGFYYALLEKTGAQ